MNKRKLTKILVIILTLAICASVFAACIFKKDPEADPTEEKYNEACSLLEKKDYEAAYALFLELGDYKDAAKKASYFRYIPTSHHVEYISDEGSDITNYTVTLNDMNLPKMIVAEYSSGSKHTCTITYNEFGYITRRECVNSDGATSLYEAIYDENGNILGDTHRDKDGNVTTFECTYNENGQISEVVTTNAPEYYYDSYTCTYDKYGREIKVVYVYDGEISIEESTYTEDGKLLKVTWSTESDEAYSINDYVYDENGRLVEILFTESGEDAGFRKTTYNDEGKILTEHVYYSFGYEYTSVFEYDKHGNAIKTVYTDDEAGDEIIETTYTFVYLPFDYTEEEWIDLSNSTMCADPTHWQ